MLLQNGTITDPLWHYYFGSIAVDAAGNVGLGFSGSHAGVYASTFVTGRHTTDPSGTNAAPIMTKAGEGAINHLDGSGRNRFGDYSHINVDPVDDLGFWTIQEYGGTSNNWKTWIARFGYETVSMATARGNDRRADAATTARPKITYGHAADGQLGGRSHGRGPPSASRPRTRRSWAARCSSRRSSPRAPLPTPSGTLGIPTPTRRRS